MKVSMKTALKKIELSLFSACAALLWTTCDVGLGEAVDTLAPTVSVSSPAASTVCKGAIDIAGSCLDDKAVASVSVVIKNTETGATYNYNASVSNLTSWSLRVNDIVQGVGYPLADGSYVADVTATDIYGRTSGTSSTAFDIDNTPPLFCVTSPASLDISNPRNYGRSVTISGEIADDHDIDKMDIRVFRVENGKPGEEITDLAKTEFKDFETAGGTTVYIAKYFDSEPPQKNPDGTDNNDWYLYKNYMAMYKSAMLDANGNSFIYVVPTLTDIAGNTSEVCYLSSNLKNLAAELCEVDITADSLQTAQLMKILNGTYSLTELDDDKKAKVLSLLNGTYELQPGEAAYYSQYVEGDDASKKKPLAASVNSNNAPTYDFNGYALDLANIQFAEVNTGGTISVSIKSGLDDWGVLPNTIKVYLDRCKASGEIYGEGEPEHKSYVSGESEGFKITNSLGEDISGISTSVTAQSYYVTLPKLSSGQFYRLKATGKDEDGNELYAAAKYYGLEVASTGAAPKIELEDKYYIKGSDTLTSGSASVTLNVTDGTDTINDGEATHYVKVTRRLYSGHISSKGYLGNNTPIDTIAEETFRGSQIDFVKTNMYTVAVQINKYNAALMQPGNYTLAIDVKAQNASAESESAFIVWIDNTTPQIIISAPENDGKVFDTDSNIAYDSETKKYTYAPYGKWSDRSGAGTSAIWYSVTDTGSAAPTISGSAEAGWTIQGNETASGSGEYFEWTRIASAVQAETETSWEIKLPAVESTGNFIKMIAVDAVGNISAVEKREGITFDFGTPTVTFEREPGASNPVKAQTYYNYYSPNASGKFEFVFKADDSLALDSTAPFEITAEKFVNGKYEAVTKGDSGYDWALGAAVAGNKSRAVTVSLTRDDGTNEPDGLSDGKWRVTVWAKDACGRKSKASQSFVTTIDCVKPQLVDYEPATATTEAKPIVIKGSGSTADWYKDETLSVAGKFKETAAALGAVESGVDKVFYWLGTPSMQKNAGTIPYVIPTDMTVKDEETGEYKYPRTDVPKSANTGTQSYLIAPTGFEEIIVEIPEGATEPVTYYNNLYIQAVDIAGNKSDIIGPFQIKEDKHEPAFEAKYYSYDDANFSEANGTAVSNGKNDMILYGTASDALSGVEGLTFEIDETEISPAITYTMDDLSGAATGADYEAATYKAYAYISDADKTKITGWRAVIGKASLASGSLYAKASDRAKNQTSKQKLFSLAIDKTSPTITLTTPVTKLSKCAYVINGTSGSDTGEAGEKPVNDVNGTMTISGTAADDYLQSVKVYVGTDSTVTIVSDDKKLIELSGTSMYNWSAENKFTYIKDGEFMFSDDTAYTGVDPYNVKDIYIKVQAVDSAANETINVYKYSVDPKSDRPLIKLYKPLNGMDSGEDNYKWVLNDTSISGSIIDDDGIDTVTVACKLYDSKTSAWVDYPEGEEPTVDLNNGSLTVNGLKGGKQIITFTVKDKAGTTFTAHAAATTESEKSFLAPRIYGNDPTPEYYGETSGGNTLLYIKVDKDPPKMRDLKYSIYDAGAVPPAYGEFKDSLATVGGKLNKFQIQFYAGDENGIKSVELKLKGAQIVEEIDADGNPKKKEVPVEETITGRVSASTTEADGFLLCTIDGIEVNPTDKEYKSGSWTAEVTIMDKGGNKSTSTFNLTVDNDKPKIEISYPKEGDGAISSSTVYGSVEKSALSYGMSKNTSDAPAAWKPIESSLSWFIYFDGDKNAPNHDMTLRDYLTEKSHGGLGITTEEDIKNGTYTALTDIYLWMKAVDEVGNESLEKFKITVDPQGDKPLVAIDGPSANGTTVGGKIRLYGSASDNEEAKAVFVQAISLGYHKTSGTYGSFTYNATTKEISNFTLKADDLNYLKAVTVKDSSGNDVPAYKIYKMATYNPDVSSTWTEWPDPDETNPDPNDYGILATLNSGRSWFLNINVSGEFADPAKTNSVAIRVYAIDAVKTSDPKTANVSAGVLRQMTFDANAPTITVPNVRKYSATVTSAAKPDSTIQYEDEMFVSGETWLSFTLNDSSAIKSLKVGLSNDKIETAQSNRETIDLPTTQKTDKETTTPGGIKAICYSPDKDPEDNTKSAALNEFVNVLVRLNTAKSHGEVGTQFISLLFEDTTNTPTVAEYTIKYDNKAPVIADVTDSAYKIDPDVRQSNGWYNFSSNVSETKLGASDQSGFERVAFYFVRRDTTATNTPTYIYDPMVKKFAVKNKITLLDNDGKAASDLVYSDGLYWIKQTVTRTASKDIITIAADERIHPYGLVKICGGIYTIGSVSGTTLKINGYPEGNSGDTVDAYFAIANVVDHQLTESADGHDLTPADYGYGYKKPKSDDGDLMVESVEKTGSDWTWSAWVYSKNIPDGPIELHYVAFDKAGNCAKGIMGCENFDEYKKRKTEDAKDAAKASPDMPISVYAFAENASSKIYKGGDKAAYVSNNAPRLANIYAGTDLDGDDEVSESEITASIYETSLSGWENAKASLVLGTEKETGAVGALVAKGKTVIRPEIIGGNGDLYYSYKISGKDGTAEYTISGKYSEKDSEGNLIPRTFMASDTGTANSREDQIKSAKADITLQVGDFKNLPRATGTGKGIADCEKDAPAKFEFTFWDSTEVTKVFENSQTAKATVYMGVAIDDKKEPTIDITPLYWKGLNDNSTYEAKNASSYAGLKGHIELPNELPGVFKDTGAAYVDPKNASVTYPAAEMDKDPKLSGVIVLTGTVSDNKMLSKIFMSVTNGANGMNKHFDAIKPAGTSADTTHCKDGAATPAAVTAYPLAVYNAGTWTVSSGLDSNGIRFSVKDKGIGEDRHSAEWTMVWDTSFVCADSDGAAKLAATDLKVRVFACDQTADSSIITGSAAAGTYCYGVDGATKYTKAAFSDNKFSAGSDTPTESQKDDKGNPIKTPYYKVDVVPYITGLETTMTKKGTAYGRSSTGRYPVYFYKYSTTSSTEMTLGETEGANNGFTIKGFNLTANNASVTKKVSDKGASDITASVYYAMAVNGVYTLNNINNDDAKGSYESSVPKTDWDTRPSATYNDWKNFCNRQPSKENNLLLTDDVAIDVWQINNMAAVPVRGIANDVTMKINEQSKMLNFAFVNGPLNLAMANGTTNSYQTWARSYDFCKSATLAVDAGGWAYGTIAGGDTGKDYADAFGLYVSNWGTGNFGDHGTQSSDQGQRRLESVGQNGSKTPHETTSEGVTTYTNTANAGTGYQTDQWRIVSPSLAATKSKTAETRNVYLAYYDEMNDEIRFKVGKSVPTATGNFGDFVDDFTKIDRAYHYRNTQIVAQANSPVAKPGPYVSIAARRDDDDKDIVVMVWHDPEARCMWYSYNVAPDKSGSTSETETKGKINNQSGSGQGWSMPTTIFTNVTGEFCQVAFDKEGHVHIAAYDSGGNDLYYAYLSGYNDSTATKKTCVVDSYGAIGTQITLDVAYSNGAPVPYIGYLAEGKTLPKLAYYTGSDITTTRESDIKGSSGNFFTRNWEVSVVPTVTAGIQGVKDYDRINVGVWKSGGDLTDSKVDGSIKVSYYDNSGNETNAKSKGFVYGNGTSNPAMAYRYEDGQDGFVETAQKK